MPCYVLQFREPYELPRSGLSRKVRFPFVALEREHIGTPRQTQNSRSSHIDIELSSTVEAIWNLKESALLKALFQVAKEHLNTTFRFDAVPSSGFVAPITSYTHPGGCPFDIELLENPASAVVEIEVKPHIGFV